jgi:hypothetical protein
MIDKRALFSISAPAAVICMLISIFTQVAIFEVMSCILSFTTMIFSIVANETKWKTWVWLFNTAIWAVIIFV